MQCISAVAGAIKDFDAAIKNALACQNRAVKNQERKVVDQAKKEAAAKLKTLTISRPASIPSEVASTVSIFDLKTDVEPVPTFDSADALPAEMTYGKPWTIKAVPTITEYIASTTMMTTQVLHVATHFPNSTEAKSTGRAAQTLKQPDLQESTAKLFHDLLAGTEMVTSDEGVYSKFGVVSIFGYTGSMNYDHFERDLQGTLRYMHFGARELFCVRFDSIVEGFKVLEAASLLPAETSRKVSKIRKALKQLSKDQWEMMRTQVDSFQIYYLMQEAGSLAFVPPGYLLCERTVSNIDALGLRYAPFPMKDADGVQDIVVPIMRSIVDVYGAEFDHVHVQTAQKMIDLLV